VALIPPRGYSADFLTLPRPLALRAFCTEDRCVGSWRLLFLVVYAPFVVFAWRIGAAVGLVAIAVLVFMAFIGSDTWAGSGPYSRR
jgi:hypothetical protein